MICYRPMTVSRYTCGILPALNTRNGKPKLFFSEEEAYNNRCPIHHGECVERFQLPCGKCTGCQLKRAAEWAVRCMHEARYYERNSFLTLTYSTPNLPEHGTLVVKHLQDFWKRLRMWLQREHNVTDTKYFACGEYGEAKGRPHYHAVLFGWDFPDKIATANNPWAKDPLYTSEALTRLWGLGNAFVGTLTEASAAYTARYTMKKVYGEKALEEYTAAKKLPPFNAMSKGIGRKYFAEFKSDFFPCDYLVTENDYRKIPVPRFYDKLLAELSEEELAHVKEQRKLRAAKLNPDDRTPERLKIREAVLKLRIQRLRRNLESVSQNESRNVTQPSQSETEYPPEGYKIGQIGPK